MQLVVEEFDVVIVVILLQLLEVSVPAFIRYAVQNAFGYESVDDGGQAIAHEIIFFLRFGGHDVGVHGRGIAAALGDIADGGDAVYIASEAG